MQNIEKIFSKKWVYALLLVCILMAAVVVHADDSNDGDDDGSIDTSTIASR